jgi:flagellar biosynthesis/type III secretory pathway protein FliH
MLLKPATQQHHPYQLCRDESCERFPCRVYKDGYRDGYDDGYRDGYDAGRASGFSEGYSAGYSDGAASASGGK